MNAADQKERNAEIVARFVAGETINALATEYRLTARYMRLLIEAAGIVVPRKPYTWRKPYTRRDKKAERNAEIVARIRAGQTLRQTAAEFNISTNRVFQIVIAAGDGA